MRRILGQKFYARPTLKVAEGLLGKFLVRRVGQKQISAMITEVEAYDGLRDRASHAFHGRTARTAVMFGPAGIWYVYLTYGMHWMLNVVSGKKDYPAAVLIRGVELVNASAHNRDYVRGRAYKKNLMCSGPGRITKHFKIDKRLNGRVAVPQNGLWIEDRGPVSGYKIKKGSRIGINYAGPYWAKRKWRFWIEV